MIDSTPIGRPVLPTCVSLDVAIKTTRLDEADLRSGDPVSLVVTDGHPVIGQHAHPIGSPKARTDNVPLLAIRRDFDHRARQGIARVLTTLRVIEIAL